VPQAAPVTTHSSHSVATTHSVTTQHTTHTIPRTTTHTTSSGPGGY
jgi:hypothetical protein